MMVIISKRINRYLGYSSNTPNFLSSTMSERCVEIPVTREIRNMIKKQKGILTYNEFFVELMRTK